MKKSIFTLLILAGIKSSIFSQVNVQAFASYVINLNKDYKGTTYGGGVRMEFGKEDATINTYIGLAYTRPIITRINQEARAYSNFTSPQTVDVETVYKIPNYRVEFGTRYYLSGSAHNYESANVFLNVGAEVLLAPNKPKYESFDMDLYTLGFSEGSDVNVDGSEKLALSLMIAIGAGFEKNLGLGNVFLHTTFALPATRNGNSDISSSIVDFTPLPLNFNIGYKFPLGSSK
jgi:hypothetical protein